MRTLLFILLTCQVCIGQVLPSARHIAVYSTSSGPAPYAAPDGWTRELPFNIYKSGSTFTTDFVISDYAPAGKAYYVSTSGSDANDGLDAAHPLLKLSTAIGKADVVVIYMAAGVYGFRNGLGSGTITKTLSIICPSGRAIISAKEEDALSYALEADPYTHVYKVARSSIGMFLDTTDTDAYGDYAKLPLKANEAEVEATPGSWWTDGVNLYVRLADDRDPSDLATVWPVFTFGGFKTVGLLTMYCANIDFIGGTFLFDATSAANKPTVYLNNCSFVHPYNQSAMIAQGGDYYLVDCTAAKGYLDGFNYDTSDGAICQVVEIGCTGRDNGKSADATDNASAIHNGGNIVRINGTYTRTIGGRTIHDVNANTQSWNLGCTASSPVGAYSNWAAGRGVAGDTATMWLDYCVSASGTYDLEAQANATVYYRDFTGDASNTGAGTITTY